MREWIPSSQAPARSQARSGRLAHVLGKYSQRFEEEAREVVRTVCLEYCNATGDCKANGARTARASVQLDLGVFVGV